MPDSTNVNTPELHEVGDISSVMSHWLNQALTDYGLVFACFVIGFIVGVTMKYLVFDKRYREQVNKRIEEKDERIIHLNILVSERLEKVKVEKHDKSFFKGLKKHFTLGSKQ